MMSLPAIVFGPVGGAIADRVNKRILLAVTQLIAVGTSGSLGLLVFADLIEFWHLVVVAFFFGIVMTLNMPARQAIVPALVPRHRLMNAISLQMGEMNLTRIVAPALAGLLISSIGVGWVFLLSAALFFAALLIEFKLPKHGLTGHSREAPLFGEVAEGFRFIWNNETVKLLIIASVLLPLFAFPVQQMQPVFAREVFDKGPAGLGLLAAMTGIGGMTGAIVAANMDRFPNKGRLLLVGGLLMGCFFIAFALSPLFELALVFLATAAIGQMLFMTTANTTIQASVPGEIRGRVVAVMMMSIGRTPSGVMPVTVGADAIGAPTTIAISSALLLTTMLTLFALSSRLRNLRLDALDQVELSPAQAAARVAAGTLSQEDADRLTGSIKLSG